MHRFFVPSMTDGDALVLADPDQLHHLKHVLRLGVGDEVVVFDDRGNESVCVVTSLGTADAVLAVKTRKSVQTLKAKLTVACAIPKRGKMDEIVDKLTQLGVDRIIPMQTARSIVRLDEEGHQARLGRWQRLAQEASQQSQRGRIPTVSRISGLSEVLSQSSDFDLKLILTLFGERTSLPEALTGNGTAKIIILIGPEGDFTPVEIRAATDAGFVPVSLGSRVLRVETAAVAAAAYISLSSGI